MAAINDLLMQVQDPILRHRLKEEFQRLSKNKKFGLVFEEHLPESTKLYGLPIKRGSVVARKTDSKNTQLLRVLQVRGQHAVCCDKNTPGEAETIPVADLVAVAEFGEPIYPYLQPVDTVCNAPDSKLWHTLIEADNYHALQLLEYLYSGKVDCIYIDPPYNTGAKDWKYNNDYVDGSDAYRHSKWLSMMKKRLELAKKLLNPADSVLIVTIDEKEYLHLGCLLEEMFPEARMQMVSVAIHSSGVARSEFSRTDEYYYYIFMGNAYPSALVLGDEWNADGIKRQTNVRWESLLRSGNNGRRIDRPNLFYPVLFSSNTHMVVGFGDPIPKEMSGKDYRAPDGIIAVLPYASDGSEACWRISSQKASELMAQGAFDWGDYKGEKTTLKYLKTGELAKIDNGEYTVTGYKKNGAMIVSSDGYKPKWVPGTQWHVTTHQAGGVGGSILIKSILGEKRFDFPKAIYAVRDSIRFVTNDKPNALIIDFFAGSGTTLHAVNLLNAEDGGNRRCIMVTNNEVSVDEAKSLTKQGYQPGDEEWEQLGIARYVTWPRTVCSIEGHDVNGKPLKGNYLNSDRPMADGFAANCTYFKLCFTDKNMVSLGTQFREILPLLWLKTGAVGSCPELLDDDLPDMLVLPENGFAVLLEETQYAAFKESLEQTEIEQVFFVTNSEMAFREMSAGVGHRKTWQLYKDYVENFTIGARRAMQ